MYAEKERNQEVITVPVVVEGDDGMMGRGIRRGSFLNALRGIRAFMLDVLKSIFQSLIDGLGWWKASAVLERSLPADIDPVFQGSVLKKNTPKPSDTPTATSTPTATNTSTPSHTPSATILPTFTPTPTPMYDVSYVYDNLNRLTEANYVSGEYFHYTYDAVGNRDFLDTHEGGTDYTYDDANRLINVDGVPYVWDANGNLLNDGVSTYDYDYDNRLIEVLGTDTYEFTYNGLGDRLSQTVNGVPTNYTLDIISGLTQVLSDGENTYLYGAGRIGEEQLGEWQFPLGDALGSVRQLTDSDGYVMLVKAYEPFGNVLSSTGDSSTHYGFTGEWTDDTGLVHLRARYYSPWQGRFVSRDVWEGDANQPMSYNAWLYGYANPINYIDPTGMWACSGHPDCDAWVKNVLDTLSQGSMTGREIVKIFDEYDQRVSAQQGVIDQASTVTCKQTGLMIVFGQPWPFDARGLALNSFVLQFKNTSSVINGPNPSNKAVSLFGHEISHYAQGIHRITIQGEVLARYVEKQLRQDLGIQSNIYIDNLVKRGIDPFSLEGLKMAK